MYQRNRKENSITGREIGVIRKRYLYDLENKKTETPKVQKSIMPTRDMQGPKNLDPNIRKKIEESRAIDYASIPKRPDFMEKSKSAGEKPGFLYETFKDTLFDWGQFNKKEKSISTLTERAKLQKHTDMQGIGNQDDIGRAINSMSDTDRGIYNYLFNTYGKDKADKYLKDYALKQSKESSEKMMKDVKEYSEKHPVLGSAASVLTTPAKWVGMYNEAYNKIKNTNEPINPYGVAYFYNNLQEAAREGVTQDMGQTGNFLYSTGMSILDSLVASTAGPLGGAAILGGGAGTDAIKDAKERGASDNQALLTGIASGTAEALFEKISLGNLKSLSEVPISSVKDIAKNVVKSVFVNASEEAATELSNTITDHIIMQDLSNYNLAYEHYLSLGMGEEEAKKRASMDMAKQIGLSALGGALSGGVMGGAGQGINYLRGSSIGRNIDTGDIDNMVDMAKTSDGTSDLYRLALEIEKRKQADKPPTNYQKGRLAIETTRMDMLNNSLRSEETSMPTQPIETPTYESKQPRIERENVKDAQATWNGIEGAKVKGISKVENNVAKVTIESGGETIIDNLSNVEFRNPNTKAIYDMSEQYKTNGAKSFVSNYQDNLDLDIYKKGFDAYYDAGLVDLPMDKVNSAYGSLLDETVRYAAYESGQNDGKALAPKTVAQDFIGVVETEASSKMDVNNREALDALGKAVGLKIQIEESLAGGEANGYYKDGTLYIALDSQNPYMVVAKHELTHSLQESSPDLYKKYKDFVISEINKSNPEAYNEMVDRLISRYSEIGENLTRDQAQDEIVADATEMFFTDSDIISRLANEDKTLADKIIGFIKDLISKLQNAIQGVKPRSRAAIALNENLEIAKKAEKLWTEALFGVQDKKTSSNLDGEKNTKFSLRENILDEKVDKSSDVYYNNIKDTLVKNFSEYKSNKEALNYATEAIKDLGKIRFSLSDKRGDVDRNKSGIRTIADGITRDFINKGYVDLKGRRVNSPADLAEIAQVFRDPRFETFRIFYVKNNKIVAHEGITSRIPGTAVAFMNIPRASDFKNDYDYNVALSKFHATKFDDMINRMKRLKADGYYLLHNHPSGSPDPSQADILVTRDYRYAVPGFKGHVIINSNTYGVLDLNLPLDKQPIHSLSQQRLDFLLQPSKQHKLLNQKINSVDSLSAVAKSLQLNKDVSCVIYTSAKGEVRGIQEIANGFIMSDDFKGYVKNQSLHFGSALAFIHTNSNDILKRSVELIEKKYLTDGVITHADGSTESLRGMGHTQDNKYQWAGIEAREISGYRVNENQYSLKDNTASYTEKRMNLILDKYGAKSSPKYSKAYVTYISPSDFLSLTTNNLSRIESESTELDIQKLQSEYQEIFLRSDMDTGEVTGHEGRHRMVALRNAGINEVPILIIPEGEKGRYNRTKIAEHKLNGEEFSTGKAKGIVDVKNLIPASYEYKDELFNTFAKKSDVRFSLKDADAIATKAEKTFGTTFNFKEAGYITVNGKLLDFSGKKQGAPGGYRTLDHREISDILDLPADAGYSDGLIEFMNQGNIRLQEYGIDISVMPNEKQVAILKRFFDRLNGEVTIDFSKADGNNAGSVDYTEGTKTSKILSDIKKYFDTGEVPELSDFDKFRYSLKDSEGNTLTKEQQEFFKDSKAIDKEGNLIRLYHGSPETKITTFDKSKSGTHSNAKEDYIFLTDNKQFAEEFSYEFTEKKHTSYIVEKGNKGKVYEVYANCRNPLDLNNLSLDQAKTIYDLSAEKELGVNDILELSHTFGGRKIIKTMLDGDKLYQKGYDSIINKLSNGAMEIGVYQSSQIKSVDNLNPSESSDIRYQLKDVDPIEYRNLKKEHKKLQEAYDLLSQQFALTAEFAPDKTILERRAKSILRKYHSKYDLDTMVENMENIWKYVQSNKDTIQVGQTVNALSGMAKMILEKSTAKDSTIRDQYKDLINDIKKTGVMLSDKDRADLASEGGYYAFKRRYRNKIKLVEDGGISIDSYFQELASTYPEFFNADEITHPAEQLVKIAEVLDSLKPISYNPYGMNIDEASIDLALEILDQGFLIPQVKPLTAAELKQNLTETEIRQRKELERLHAQYQEKIENVRQEYRTWFNERLGRIKTENEVKVKKLLEQHNKANEREKEILMRQIQRLRDSKLQRLQAQQERYNERMHAYKQRKSVQADMNKWKSNIRKIAKDLSSKLLRPTDQKHIPAGLKSSIIQVCQLLDFETGRTGPQGEPTQVALKLRNLQSEYAKLANETDESISAFYDEDMSIALTELAETTQGRSINQLSYDELKQVQDIMRHIRHIVNLENKMFSENIRESIAFAGESQIAHHNSSKEFKQMDVVAKSKALKAFSDLLGKGNIKPYYFFKQLGGSLHSLYKNIRDGEDAFIKNFEKGKDYAKDIISKYDYFSWAKNDKPQEFVTSSGESIYLTTGEKLYIYMAYQREQGKGHILGGGVVPSSQVSKKGKTSEQSKPIRFDEGDMTKLASTLTDEQINFAKEMGEYLSNDLAQLGNEVSLKMYGYEKFTEKNYIPLTSDPNFLTSRAGVVDDRRIKRAGFTKATTPKANNPVIAADFLEVWSKHLTDMSMYNAFVLPITDFERVWNYRVKDKDGKISSVKSAIQREYGKRANDYIKNLLNDINGGIKAPVGGELSNILLAKMKADAVMGNLSVAIQQPSAIARALVIIDPKYFVKATFSKRDYNELKKYSPQAILKEYGYFDVNMGRNLTDLITQPEYEGPMEKFKAFFTDKNVRNDVFSWLPQKMDEITWSHIWNAIKAETKAETKLIEGSEEFYQHVAERFKEVIDRSQVMDSVFQRSEIMRSQNFAAKLATSFMSEPTVNYNMLYDAVSEYKKKGKSITPYVTRTVASVVSAMVLNSILKSIVTAMRSKDDKEYAEKYLDSFVSNLLDDPVSMIPYVNTVFSIFQGYNANRPDMQIVQNLYYAWKKLDSDKYSTNEKALQVAQAIAPFFNVPLKSLTRDIESIFRTGKKAFEKAGLTEELPKYESLKIKYDINDLDNSKASSEYYDYLYSIRGTEEYNEVYRELIKSGRKPTNINQAMSNREKLELYNRKKDEEYTHPLIIEAVDAIERSDAKGYKAAISELQKEYEAKVILSAINSLKSERAKENAPSPEEFVEAYKAGDKEKWLPLFRKLRAAGWSQKDLLELVK